VPRAEPPDGLTGGKIVKVDRVEWNVIPDATTAALAIGKGEADFWDSPTNDVLPTLDKNKDVVVGKLAPFGNFGFLRVNSLFPPFNNPKARQALAYAFDQSDFMAAAYGDQKWWKICYSYFICGAPYGTEVGSEPYHKQDLAKAKELFAEAGYKGEKLTFITTDELPQIGIMARVAAATLQKIGVDVDLQVMAWGNVVQRQVMKDDPAKGGWNLFTSWGTGSTFHHPLSSIGVPMPCDGKNWSGWPCDEQAEKLRNQFVRETDTTARLGGDEFAILQANVAHPADAATLASRFLSEISEPFDVMGHQILVGASVGIALISGDGNDADHLLMKADLALYRAKADGKATFRFFEPEMDARAQARRRLETDLRQATLAGTLEIHYQPLVQLESGQISGFEALLRWPHAERGLIPPSEFIPVAEETGLIMSLGAHALNRACADAAKWPPHVKLAVNLSPLQFRSGNLLSTVKHALEQSGISPERLELEITEAVLLEKVDHILATLHALRAIGVSISMDDFGTGYSSLSYLRSFPFDKIKIDRSFVENLGSNAEAQAIVRTILSLGTSLGMTITAEGIETDAELACLKAAGCHQGQGYLFSKPRPQAEILMLLDKQTPQAA